MDRIIKEIFTAVFRAAGCLADGGLRVVATGFLLVGLALPFSGAVAYCADEANEKGSAPSYANPHDINNRQTCKVCHEPESMKLRQDPISTCLRCHEGNRDGHPVSRHPVGQQSKIKFPKALPAAPGNKIVCYTCHEPHNKSGNARLLRIKFDALCAACHVGY